MTNEEFGAWRDRLGLTFQAAAEALGTSERSVYNYAACGEPRFVIPRYIELACSELERRHNEVPISPGDFIADLPASSITYKLTGATWRLWPNRNFDLIREGVPSARSRPQLREVAFRVLKNTEAGDAIFYQRPMRF